MTMTICDHVKECGAIHDYFCPACVPHKCSHPDNYVCDCISESAKKQVHVHCIPVPATEDESRAKFEKWMSMNGMINNVSRPYDDGRYASEAVQLAWEAWQEARKG